MIKESELQNLLNSICFWLSHNHAIGRSHMLQEASIRYPFADALTSLDFKTKDLVLERGHPYYHKRSIDLVTVDNCQNISNAFEFKLATKSSSGLSEKKRFFNDLMRLHVLSKKENIDSYFIVVGEYSFFNSFFRRILTREEANKVSKENADKPYGFFTKWFKFAKGLEQDITVKHETVPEYKDVYKDFYGNDKSPYRIKEGANLDAELPTKITTKCECISVLSPDYHNPWVGAIWKVK